VEPNQKRLIALILLRKWKNSSLPKYTIKKEGETGYWFMNTTGDAIQPMVHAG
jgi:hypothetical protein